MVEERTLDELFTDIEKKVGAYSIDRLSHASNVIYNMSQCGKKIRVVLVERLKRMVREAENQEIYDVKHGLYCLLKDLGVNVGKDEYGDYYLEEKEG